MKKLFTCLFAVFCIMGAFSQNSSAEMREDDTVFCAESDSVWDDYAVDELPAQEEYAQEEYVDKTLSYWEWHECDPTIAKGTSLSKIIGWYWLLVIAVFGIIFWSAGLKNMAKGVWSFVLVTSVGYYIFSGYDYSSYQYVWALVGLYLFACAGWFFLSLLLFSILTIYNIIIQKGWRRRKLLLTVAIVFYCTVFPVLSFIDPITSVILFLIALIIPIAYQLFVIRKWDAGISKLLRLVGPYYCGITVSLFTVLFFYLMTKSAGEQIREIMYYIKYLIARV